MNSVQKAMPAYLCNYEQTLPRHCLQHQDGIVLQIWNLEFGNNLAWVDADGEHAVVLPWTDTEQKP